MSRRVLFIEAPRLRYGSSISLLTLIESLDRNRYLPHVAVHKDNPLIHDLVARGIANLPLDIPDWGVGKTHSAATAGDSRPSTPDPVGMRRVAAPMLDCLRRLRDRAQYAEVTRSLRHFIRAHAIDLLHPNNQPSTNRFAYMAAGNLPIVQHVRDAPLTPSRISQQLTRRANAVICISDFVAASARTALAAATDNVSVLPNPVPERFFAAPVDGTLRRQLNLAADDVIFAQVGRFVEWKGQDLFLDAFSRAIAEMPSGTRMPKAVFIGTGDESPTFESALRRKASTHHLQGHVHFVPYTKDILSLFLDIDVLVHFTRVGEGFGRVIVEAMAAECGLLVSNNGALPELVDHGQNGFVAQDAEELFKYMKLMASDSERLTQLKATARQLANQYQPSLIARRLETIYDRVLDGDA